MDQLHNQKTINADSVFGRHFLDSKSLYLYHFEALPSIHYIGNMNGEKGYNAFKEKYAHLISSEHQMRYYDKKRKGYEFSETIMVLNNHCLIEFNVGYCELLHDGQSDEFVMECTKLMSRFKKRERRKPLEINLIVKESYGLDLKSLEIKRTKLDLNLFYEDDFRETDQTIISRLSRKEDKGIVLLHGLPGTGKTTYLRNLVGRIKKRILFLSPGIAGDLMNPELIDMLIDNPNTVVIIEDAENIIMDRRFSGSSAVSNLLNISDGLLADFLNIQIICTFNSSLTLIDNALLRKGRLIAKYEFGKLGIEKAQRLSNHFGFEAVISKPMTIAEIANQHEREQESTRVEIFGFRRREVLEN